jgi:nucleotidyltransferase substrate binding protein (TIGR01987 family)
MELKSTNRYNSFCRSLQNLKQARGKNPEDMFVLSGTVQLYNLCFDLSWKVMKDILTEYHGITDFATGSPRETLKTAYKTGLIEDDKWMSMLKARNNLSHDYDGKLAQNYFNKIIVEFIPLFETLKTTFQTYFNENQGEQI